MSAGRAAVNPRGTAMPVGGVPGGRRRPDPSSGGGTVAGGIGGAGVSLKSRYTVPEVVDDVQLAGGVDAEARRARGRGAEVAGVLDEVAGRRLAGGRVRS